MSDASLAATQVEALAFIDACCRDLVPIAALSGAAGTGKSVTLVAVASQRESLGDRVIRISNFVAGPLSLHRVIAQALGVAEAGELSVDELEPVMRRALAATGRHEPPVLAIDDAQSLLPETLRYLCLLAGLREAGRPLFRIILVGRPGFTVRQPIPVQATLEALQPDAARQTVERMLASRGLQGPDDAVREIVQHAQGNLRRTDLLVQACTQELQRSGRKRLSVELVQVAAGARPAIRRSRGRIRPRAWMALPVLLAVLVAGYGIVHHGSGSGAPAEVVATTTPAGPATTVPAPPASPLPPAPTGTDQAATSPPHDAGHASGAPVQPSQLQAPDVASPSTQPAGTRDGGVPPTDHPAAPSAGPAITTEALPPAAPPAPPPQALAALPPPASVPQAPMPPVPVPQAPAPQVPARQVPALLAPVPQAAPPPAAAVADVSRYRLYNVAPCHHGVCPRWAVLNLDRQSRSYAGFNPKGLGLPLDTVQRLREGVLDVVVMGRIEGAGAGGRMLDAVRLVSVEPHHGRQPQPAREDDLQIPGPASDPGPVPASGQAPAVETQSPPPGYLQPPQGAIRLAPP